MLEDLKTLENSIDIKAGHHHCSLLHPFWSLVCLANVQRRKVKNRGFLSDRPAVGKYGACIHLQVYVINESERFEQSDPWTEDKLAILDALARARMRTHDHWLSVAIRDRVQRLEEATKSALFVNVFFAMCAYKDVVVLLQSKASEGIRSFHLRLVIRKNFAHWTTDLDDLIGRQTLREKVFTRNRRISQIDVRHMVDDPVVDLFGSPMVEAAITRLNVENRHLAALRSYRGETAIGIAEHQECVESVLGEKSIDFDDDLSDRLGGAVARRPEKHIGRSDFEIAEKDVVEVLVIVLAGVDEAMIAVLIELRNNPSQANDLRPRPDDRHYPQALHFSSLGPSSALSKFSLTLLR